MKLPNLSSGRGNALRGGGYALAVTAVVLAILVAVVIYGVLVIALRAITKDDLMLMPKGEKIARMLHL